MSQRQVRKVSKYTIRIKDILENYYILSKQNLSLETFNIADLDNNVGVWDNPFQKKYKDYKTPFDTVDPTVDEILESTWNKLFDFKFPTLPDYKTGQLEKNILKAYYMREIGFETIERFKLALNQTLNRIMPYYIELYKSISLHGENPLENYDLIDHSDRKTDSKSTGTNNGTETSNGSAKQVYEDTPSNELGAGTNYATNVTKNEANNTSTSKNDSTGTNAVTDTYDRHAHGIMGYSKQDLIERYRENILNVEELIIMELRDLFMLLY